MPIEARGKKDPALAARIRSGVLPEDEAGDVEYVVGRRPLKVGEETRQPGDPIPEAAGWPRLESWLRSGAIAQRPAVRSRSEVREIVSRVEPQRPGPEKMTDEEHVIRPVLRPLRNRTGADA